MKKLYRTKVLTLSPICYGGAMVAYPLFTIDTAFPVLSVGDRMSILVPGQGYMNCGSVTFLCKEDKR